MGMPRGGFDGTEWHCLKCNQINFARNTHCYRCEVSRAEAEAEHNMAQAAITQKQKVLAYLGLLNKKFESDIAPPVKAAPVRSEADPKKDKTEPPKVKDRSRSRSHSSKKDRSRSRSYSSRSRSPSRRRRRRKKSRSRSISSDRS